MLECCCLTCGAVWGRNLGDTLNCHIEGIEVPAHASNKLLKSIEVDRRAAIVLMLGPVCTDFLIGQCWLPTGNQAWQGKNNEIIDRCPLKTQLMADVQLPRLITKG